MRNFLLLRRFKLIAIDKLQISFFKVFHVYAIVNHHKVAKETWDRVNLLMQGTKLSLQEKECRLYDESDKFTYVKGEAQYQYYWRFAQLINNMNVINMSMRPVQASGLAIPDGQVAIPVFNHEDDPITSVASSRFPSTNNQLRNSFNPRNQDGRVTVQQVQGMQGQSYSGTGYKGNATSLGESNIGGQARVVKCYNCQAEAQEAGQILDEEQLAFLVDPGFLNGSAIQTTILNNVAFQTEDLDAYDSDCDDVSNSKAVLMANLSSYGSDVLSEEKANQEKNNESLTAALERYKERLKTFEQRLNIDLSTREKIIDSQMDDMIKEKLALKQHIDSLEQNMLSQNT
nr:hypothetical protein [Tanacetum cinerariifolium]